jgi:hypothetical protein
MLNYQHNYESATIFYKIIAVKYFQFHKILIFFKKKTR